MVRKLLSGILALAMLTGFAMPVALADEVQPIDNIEQVDATVDVIDVTEAPEPSCDAQVDVQNTPEAPTDVVPTVAAVEQAKLDETELDLNDVVQDNSSVSDSSGYSVVWGADPGPAHVIDVPLGYQSDMYNYVLDAEGNKIEPYSVDVVISDQGKNFYSIDVHKDSFGTLIRINGINSTNGQAYPFTVNIYPEEGGECISAEFYALVIPYDNIHWNRNIPDPINVDLDDYYDIYFWATNDEGTFQIEPYDVVVDIPDASKNYFTCDIYSSDSEHFATVVAIHGLKGTSGVSYPFTVNVYSSSDTIEESIKFNVVVVGTGETPEPTPSVTATPEPTPSVTATPEPTPTVTATPEPTSTPTAAPTEPAQTRTGVVVNVPSSLNIRPTASMDSQPITTVKNGTVLTILGEEGDFYRVQLADGTIGYASKDYVRETTDEPAPTEPAPTEPAPTEPVPTEPVPARKGVVVNVRTSLNIRPSADTTGRPLTTVKNGTELTILGEEGDFYRVQLADGTIGYASMDYVSERASIDPDEYDYFVQVATNGGRLNLRKTPGGTRIALIPNGTRLVIVDVVGEWSLVEYDGLRGYVSNQYIKNVLF